MDPNAPLDLSTYKTRQLEVQGVMFTVMANVTYESNGWRVSVERAGEKRSRKFFAFAVYEGPRAALDAAHRWLISLRVRRPYEGIDLAREPVRKLELRRHILDGEVPEYGFTLRISASKSVQQRPWMTIDLGPASKLTQSKLVIEIARLHGRWIEYRRRRLILGDEQALDSDYRKAPMAQTSEHNTRLMVGDIRRWTGVARGVAFMGTKPRPTAAEPAQPDMALVLRARRAKAKLA